VTQLREHHQLAAGDVAVKLLGVAWQDQAVLPAPQDQRRQLQFADPPGFRGTASRGEALRQRGAIALPQRQLVVAVDQRRGDARRVAVRVAQAGLDDAARQHRSHQPAEQWHARDAKADRH